MMEKEEEDERGEGRKLERGNGKERGGRMSLIDSFDHTLFIENLLGSGFVLDARG